MGFHKLILRLFSCAGLFGFWFLLFGIFPSGCAQIGTPTGGAKDTLAPNLINASPADGSVNVQKNTITLSFSEYIDVQDIQQNLVVSPLQNRNPVITPYPRSIVIKFRDTLLPNTTYTINFGNAVRDVNEGNIYENLSYRFSTGAQLDTLGLNGTFTDAETGLPDSTWIVVLYRNPADSAVRKLKPNYYTRVDRAGNFTFQNLPSQPFRIYALKDGDGSKTYNSKSEGFAFLKTVVEPGTDRQIELSGYREEIEEDRSPEKNILQKAKEKVLRFTVRGEPRQDILRPLELSFNNVLAKADPDSVILTDTLFRRFTVTKKELDSTGKTFNIYHDWKPDSAFNVLVYRAGFADSAKNIPPKSDTIRMVTARISDYGKLVIRFNNLDISKRPVLEFLSNGSLAYSYPLTSAEWTRELFPPGEYGVRILYDSDGNGKWTPGSFENSRQPELRVIFPQKITVKNNWENEREINL